MQRVLITDDGHPYYAIRTEDGYVRDESQARVRLAHELAANELEEKLMREARMAPNGQQRNGWQQAAKSMRMLSDCTLGWPVVKGGK